MVTITKEETKTFNDIEEKEVNEVTTTIKGLPREVRQRIYGYVEGLKALRTV
ncbi:hypothetical protein AN1V17_11480 [Vallitalea sediminicola]